MVKLHNEIVKMGFRSRSSFFNVALEKFPEMNNKKGIEDLKRWYHFRVVNEDLNYKIESIILTLKNE